MLHSLEAEFGTDEIEGKSPLIRDSVLVISVAGVVSRCGARFFVFPKRRAPGAPAEGPAAPAEEPGAPAEGPEAAAAPAEGPEAAAAPAEGPGAELADEGPKLKKARYCLLCRAVFADGHGHRSRMNKTGGGDHKSRMLTDTEREEQI